jgi:hypothetical protein
MLISKGLQPFIEMRDEMENLEIALSFVVSVISMVSLAPLLFFLAVFVRRASSTRQRMLFLLVILFIVESLHQGLMTFAMTSSIHEFVATLYIVAEILGIVSMVVLLLILEYFEENKALTPRVVALLTIAAVVFGTMVSDPEFKAASIPTPFGNAVMIEYHYTISTIILLIAFFCLTAIYLFATAIKKRRIARNKQQRSLVAWLYVGIFLSQFAGLFTHVVTSNVDAALAWIRSLGSLSQIVGTIIVGIAFFRVLNRPWLLQIQPNHFLVVYSKDGLPLYTKAFRPEISEADIQMLTGAISAITAVFKVTMNLANPIEEIKFKGKIVRIINKYTFVCALMVDHLSQVSEVAQDNFAQEFDSEYGIDLLGFTGDVSIFSETNKIVERYFA